MRKRALRGFTLIEIMFAVGLSAIIAATVILPLVLTVESLENAQKQWGQNAKVRIAVEKIFYDVRNFVENPSFLSFRTVHNNGLTVKNDDRLLVWSAAPTMENKPVGLIIYRVMPPASGLDKKNGRLYRWVITNVKASSGLSGTNYLTDEAPIMLDTDKLKTEDGAMILNGVDGISFWVWSDKEWTNHYEGSLPEALRVEVTVNGKKYIHEELLPVISR